MSITFKYDYPKYSKISAPYIDVLISNPIEDDSLKVKALLDTGYDGDFLIPYSIFVKLNLMAYLIDSNVEVYGESITGEVFNIKSSIGISKLEETKFIKKTIFDTYKNNKETLIGRKFIEKMKVTLQDAEIHLDNL